MIKKTILPPLIAAIYWLWSHTWRFTVLESPAFLSTKKTGPIAFAHWHGDEMVVLRLGPRYHCAAMTSTSEDGELMTRILRFFGFGISRGSSTRGGARALIGMVKMVEQGYSATVAVDGPKGPRHKVKAGIWLISKHAQASIIPTGVAKSSALVFHRSWNKTFIPWPFAKVIVSFGEPLPVPQNTDDEALVLLQKILEDKLHLERGRAQAYLMGRPID